jgi:inosine-uridine nucleoside N-ribohydrolase
VDERPRILLDCDPGHDDAIAIALALAHTDLVGVTTVGGNADVALTTANALAVLDLFGSSVPVHQGLDEPIGGRRMARGEHIHGATGLDGADVPRSTRAVAGDDAVAYLVDTIRAEEGLWLVPTGPLTNVATMLTVAPDVAGRLAGISFMGGSAGAGNRTAVAEFNVWADPEAAARVFSSGLDVTMIGLDVTHQALVTTADTERLRGLGRTGSMVAELLDFFSRYHAGTYGFDGAPVHDAVAVAHVVRPDLVESIDTHVAVECGSELCRGRTVVDRWRRTGNPPNATVGIGIDRAAFVELLTERLAAFP